MKTILAYFRQFFPIRPGWTFVLAFFAWNALWVGLNYATPLGEDTLRELPYGPGRFLAYVAWYSLAFAGTLGICRLWGPADWQMAPVKNAGLACLVVLMFLGFYADFYYYRFWFPADLSYPVQHFAFRVSSNAGKALFAFLGLLLIRRYFTLREDRFYGLAKTDVNLKPYLAMLAAMVPILALASFQPDFQDFYPRYRSTELADQSGIPFWILALVFETAYGSDFIAVELVFRGLLVLFLGRYLGKPAVFGMVTLYGMLHFAKPLGETISSYFGGLILGVIAWESRSILGGVFIHLGVAWLMELLAWWQIFRHSSGER